MEAVVRLGRSRTLHVLAAALLAGSILLTVSTPRASAAGSGGIGGTVWNDANRNGVVDAGEAPFSNEGIMLFNSAGTNIASAGTGADGRFVFSGLADGTYTVDFYYPDWTTLRSTWVPTTTGSLYYRRTVTISAGSAANADIGLRQIVRSTTLGSPISAYTAPSGLHIESYDDAVTAQAVYAALQLGTQLGGEQATTRVYFDIGTLTDATTGVSGGPGAYSNFSASLWIAYLSWLDNGDEVLWHEYGHDWSLYNAYITQQTGSLDSYVQARGLTGDPRLGTSKYWDPKEMIAEDYRELFGSPNAAAYPQANTDIPPASQVSGLKDFLQNTFTTPPSSSSTTTSSTTTTTAPAPAVSISGLAVTPQPVVKSATVGFSISVSATTTVQIRDAKGNLVRTLDAGTSRAAGSVSLLWDRKNATGQRVKSGTYTALVGATDASGNHATATAGVQVG